MIESELPSIQTISIIGGTGKEGKGLAYRWALAGYKIIIGSRQVEKAQAAAEEIDSMLSTNKDVIGLTNPEAAKLGDLIVLTVPFNAHVAMLETIKTIIQGKILIDVTVPLGPKVTRVQMPPAGSAAQEAKLVVGDAVEVVSAFQNISYENLLHNQEIGCDVLVCGTSKVARSVVIKLVKDAGMVGWDAGPLENSVVVEGLTSILIGINKQHGTLAAGIQITGVPRPDKTG